MRTALATAVVVLALAVPAAHAQDPAEIVQEGVVEQSCRSLQGGTAGVPDQAPADPGAGIPATWAEAPQGLLPPRVDLRTQTETFNRRYEFATRSGRIFGRDRGATGPWREMPLPPCFAGRVDSIALDDDEMIALDDARRIFTMDNALKDASTFNWTARWGTPFWTGTGFALPGGVIAWSWSVVSPVEDKTWTDPAGNRTAIGSGKVSHIWGLRTGGRRLTFWDPWLPPDESYEMCGPHRGRFRAVNLSASGSFVFVIGPRGDLFTRLYDFDISGHDPVFFSYSYEDQRGKGDGAPIQLPAAPWVQQPKVPGTITSAISIHKVGVDSIHRILRVEGENGGRTGYWERDTAAPVADGWKFVATGMPLTRARLPNPARDTSAVGLAPGEDHRYVMRGNGMEAELLDFNVYCSPARVRVRENGAVRELVLHHVDGLRQQARGRGLDDNPRTQSGVLRESDGTLEAVTVRATRSEVVLEELGWRFVREDPPASAPGSSAARACLPRRASLGRGRLGLTRKALLRRLPAPVLRGRVTWRWCVEGGGRVTTVFGPHGRAALVMTTAPQHGTRRVHPGARLSSRWRRIARHLVRVGPRTVVGVRRGRVRFVAVGSRRTIAHTARLQRMLRVARP